MTSDEILEAFKQRAVQWRDAREQILAQERSSPYWFNDIQWSDDAGCQIVEDLADLTKGEP